MSKTLAVPLRRVCQSLERETLRSLPDRQLLEQFAGGNGSAFAAIVERHGPLVRGVCQRVLRDASLADDAFQAVFVVLARKSRSLRRPEALAGWLFGVARKIAGQMRQSQIRLRRREQAAALRHPEAAELKPWDDLLQVLDEELNHLPERLRAPLVACYLEGRTQDEAARELGWPLITLRRRLAAGRERLRLRMDRRGATLSAGLLAAALTPGADAAISASLV
jgi:RNA polymerase sigma factor (sigma-70 family)